jgi:UDP-glucuronate 4-epimerase
LSRGDEGAESRSGGIDGGRRRFYWFHVTQRLLRSGQRVVGLDNLNAYYDPRLKAARLDILGSDPRFHFENAGFGRSPRHQGNLARQQFPVIVRRGGGTR